MASLLLMDCAAHLAVRDDDLSRAEGVAGPPNPRTGRGGLDDGRVYLGL
jgi:hypothetical protein